MTNPSSSDFTVLDRYARALGTVFTNLQSLEFVLRLFLYRKRSRPHTSFMRGQNLTGLRVGTTLPENAVTGYDSLRDLICRYNAIAARGMPGLQIDKNLVSLRDALAHGRVFVPKTGLPLQLLKFTKPRDRKVKVNFASTLTLEWLTEQSTRVRIEIDMVYAAAGVYRQRRRAQPSVAVDRPRAAGH